MNLQWAAVWSDNVHLQLTISSIEFGIGGVIGDVVFVSNVGSDVVKDFRHLRLEPREIGAAARHAGESIHLIVSLQEICLANAAHHSVSVRPFAQGAPDADGID